MAGDDKMIDDKNTFFEIEVRENLRLYLAIAKISDVSKMQHNNTPILQF